MPALELARPWLGTCLSQVNEINYHVTYIPLKQYKDFSPEMLDGLGELDLVCVDDLEYISDSIEWQQRLTLLFNEIRDNHNSIIISSVVSPKNINIELIAQIHNRTIGGIIGKQRTIAYNMYVKKVSIEDIIIKTKLHFICYLQ